MTSHNPPLETSVLCVTAALSCDQWGAPAKEETSPWCLQPLSVFIIHYYRQVYSPVQSSQTTSNTPAALLPFPRADAQRRCTSHPDFKYSLSLNFADKKEELVAQNNGNKNTPPLFLSHASSRSRRVCSLCFALETRFSFCCCCCLLWSSWAKSS